MTKNQSLALGKEIANQIAIQIAKLETIISPLAVFCIAYLHHLYFGSDYYSPTFVAISVASILLVAWYRMQGLYAAGILQLGLLGCIGYQMPGLFVEQALFSVSVLAALGASLFAEKQAETPKSQFQEKKELLWQELFDARCEITKLYAEKKELEVRLEVQEEERQNSLEQQLQAELTIEKLIANMAAMAERAMAERAAVKPLPAPVAAKKELFEDKFFEAKLFEAKLFEAKYAQLKEQFEEKSHVLDSTRRELFYAQEEVEKLKRTLAETPVPSPYEKALMEQLALTNKELAVVQKAHQDELLGYEGVIQGLFEQLRAKA